MKHHKFVSAVIRCRNAESRIEHFLTSVDAALDAQFDAFEIVVVNDGSTDSSSQIVKDIAGRLHAAVSVIEMAHHHGIEAAMVAGLDRAMGDFVFEFEDTYLDFPVDILSRMYKTAIGGFDIVAAVPSTLPRRTRAFYRWCNRFSSFEPPLAYERLRVSSRRAVDAMLQQRERVRYRQVLYRFTGYRYARLDYAPDPRWARGGENDLRFALDVIFSVTESGVRLARLFVLVFAVIAVVGVISTVVLSIVEQTPAWELILAVIVAVGFCGVFVIQAVIGEYAARILAEVRSRPLYTLDKTMTWTRTPTETAWAPVPVPTEDRVLALGDAEPFMLRQRREAEGDRLTAEGGGASSHVEPPALS